MSTSGHILCDLDGTLAHYAGWKGPEHIGEPVPLMLKRVKRWLAEGTTVKLFTARANTPECIPHIRAWLDKHGLEAIKEITISKDFATSEIWDDRAHGVRPNMGILRESVIAFHLTKLANALGFTVTEDTKPDELADACAKKILKMNDALSTAQAHMDSASDALSYIKGDSGGPRSDLNRARLSLSKAHKAVTEALAK